ncbi:outer membrane protein assembly factor BamB family protein [Streptomyces beihaiensis]|uniref:PQQ-binding-like beta-propeller repeat protein n=1 Tax=Streptomyces beihaiensis TaxID=2984495 RepID=A0ABT3TUD1_9ACTN|nr:PQQ-binding-like beta-propeller repeat protein [Streptomyces beihaiensis]MCX3060632.1 PQQ-binding-like beta-propeller repeat protein [Streptomyces beihaiensis]
MTQPPQQPQQPPNEPPRPPQDPLRKQPEPQDRAPQPQDQEPQPQDAPPPPGAPPAPPAGGGFGAPTPPPPGGFGAPSAPAAPPAYGYPQAAPQTPPAPGPGYGYPAQQPPAPQPQQPYGQPQYGQPQYGQQPYGRQQYGYPQPPTAPMQPGGGDGSGGGKKVSPITWIITAAVVVIALIVGGGIMYAKSSDSGKDDTKNSADGKDGGKGTGGKGQNGQGGSGGGSLEKVPANTSAKIAFQLASPKVAKDAVWSVAGSWLTDSTYVKPALGQLVGYDPDSGTKKWTLPLPGQTCGAAPQVTKDGLTAVLSEDGVRKKDKDYFPCTEITVFNVNTGKRVWSDSVKISGQKLRFKELSITGNTLAVGGGSEGGAAFELTSGKSLWKPQQGDCEDVGYRGGDQLVAVRRCGAYDSGTYEVQALDPASGKPKWSYKVPAKVNLLSVLSTKPVVFGIAVGESVRYKDVFSLDDTGKMRARISLDPDKYDLNCEVGEVHGCKGVAVGNDRLYLGSQQHAGAGSDQINEIVSWGLADGKQTSDRFDSGDGYRVFPVRMDGGNILAYKDGPYNKGSQIVTIDPKSSKQTVLLETPATETVRDAISGMVPDSSEILYSGGRLFFGKKLISQPYTADEKEYTALGFTTNQ